MLRGLVGLSLLLLSAACWAQECPDYASDPALLVDLEEGATRGALEQDEKDCLEKNFAAASEQTTKDKISRVLLVNAYAYSTKYWAKLVRRHLDDVDRSDPDIAYLYAFYLFNTDQGDPDEVIRWAEIALERKDVWTGRVYVARVYGLMKLRAAAANTMWIEAEEARARGTAAVDVEELRNRVKTYAREWVDFAKSADRDLTESLTVCLSAATRARACGVEE